MEDDYDGDGEYRRWDDEDEWDEDEYLTCSPLKCGDCWLGDDLCKKELEELSRQQEEFEKLYVKQNIACPKCQKLLTQFSIPTDTLWVWAGDWGDGKYYNQMIALSIFAVYSAPKGEVHRTKIDGIEYCHIWVGVGKTRREELIALTGNVISND